MKTRIDKLRKYYKQFSITFEVDLKKNYENIRAANNSFRNLKTMIFF